VPIAEDIRFDDARFSGDSLRRVAATINRRRYIFDDDVARPSPR
jgi:hypothetical protein